MKIDTGQGITRWALEQRAKSLRRYISTAWGERLQKMRDELAEIEDTLDEDNAKETR